MPPQRHLAPLLLALALVGGHAAPAFAAPDEIQVYTEEMDDPGQFGLELHVNYSAVGKTQPAYSHQTPPNHVLQVTPEFSYGITPNLEAGLYVPFAIAPDGKSYENGLRGRLKYIAPRPDGSPFFWGLNVELGHSSARVSESQTTLEIRPIIGYRDKNWLADINPILDANLSANTSRVPALEPAVKVSRHLQGETWAGLEYYGSYGPIKHLSQGADQSHYLFGAVDFAYRGYDFNLGIGRGYAAADDKWVIKGIIAFPF